MKKIIFLIALLISDLQAATTIFTNECIFTPNRDFVKIHVLNGLKQATFFSGGIAIFHFSDGNGDILGTSSSNGQAFISSGFSYTGNIGNTTPLTTQTLQVGSNVSINDSDDDKIVVTGNVYVSKNIRVLDDVDCFQVRTTNIFIKKQIVSAQSARSSSAMVL